MVETPYRAGGVNLVQLAVTDHPTPRLSTHDEIDLLLENCQALSAPVVRAATLAASVGANSYSLVTGVSGVGSSPTITYNDFAWETIDYAVAAAAQRGLYLTVALVDENAPYYGGKRTWVNFRRPGTCSTNPAITGATSSAQRAAESFFYTDPQIRSDFRQHATNWLTHVNRYTGRANRDEPAIAVVELGDRLSSARDHPTWSPDTARHLKTIAPATMVADGAAADGLPLVAEHLSSPHIDVMGTEVLTLHDAASVTALARTAAAARKAFWVRGYGWSQVGASAVEQAVRAEPNVFTSAFHMLRENNDLRPGDGYGGLYTPLYVPGKTPTEVAANERLRRHGDLLAGRATDVGGGDDIWSDTYPDTAAVAEYAALRAEIVALRQRYPVNTAETNSHIVSVFAARLSAVARSGQYTDVRNTPAPAPASGYGQDYANAYGEGGAQPAAGFGSRFGARFGS